mmetsp:Transcript_22005/g.60910  ORF Transcript_22005/g.60910 Transcript_22005/m.60910 type:complete len:95 (+) Transcript_22005:980-1264(+)
MAALDVDVEVATWGNVAGVGVEDVSVDINIVVGACVEGPGVDGATNLQGSGHRLPPGLLLASKAWNASKPEVLVRPSYHVGCIFKPVCIAHSTD